MSSWSVKIWDTRRDRRQRAESRGQMTDFRGQMRVGGLTTREAQALLRGLRGLNLIGGDVVEVSPPDDPAGNTARAAATMIFEILCLLAEARDNPLG